MFDESFCKRVNLRVGDRGRSGSEAYVGGYHGMRVLALILCPFGWPGTSCHLG